MRILCTNDDGIHGPGLAIVEEIARALSDDVWVVAPEQDQSGVSHSLSLNDPLRLRESACATSGAGHADRLRSWALHPREKLPDPPCPASTRAATRRRRGHPGTIAGALEGTILASLVRAVAGISIETRHKPLGNRAKFDRRSCASDDAGIPKNTVINVNFPACTPEEVAGTRDAAGKRNYFKVDKRHDGRVIRISDRLNARR